MKPVIILDPGHSAVSPSGVYDTAPKKMFKFQNGFTAYEGKYNRLFVNYIKHYLEQQYGYDVYLTVGNDIYTDISLRNRCIYSNKFRNAVFASFHSNASPSHKGTGLEIYTTPKNNNSDKFAECIYKNMAEFAMKNYVRMRPDISDGDHDKEANFYVLKYVNHPAVLIENMFFDNIHDIQKLEDKTFINNLSKFEAKGIHEYIVKYK